MKLSLDSNRKWGLETERPRRTFETKAWKRKMAIFNSGHQILTDSSPFQMSFCLPNLLFFETFTFTFLHLLLPFLPLHIPGLSFFFDLNSFSRFHFTVKHFILGNYIQYVNWRDHSTCRGTQNEKSHWFQQLIISWLKVVQLWHYVISSQSSDAWRKQSLRPWHLAHDFWIVFLLFSPPILKSFIMTSYLLYVFRDVYISLTFLCFGKISSEEAVSRPESENRNP